MAPRRKGEAGLTLIEVTISLMVVAALLLASAGAFGSSLKATEQAKRVTDAGVFLETTMESVSAQPYDNLLALNGNSIFDETGAGDSNYRVDLTAFQVEVGLVQLRAVLVDLQTGRQLGRLSTQRCDR